MNPLAKRSPDQRPRLVMAILVAIDFIVSLTPQLHWAVGNGTPSASIGYFLGTGVFITMTLGVMMAIDPDKGTNQ